MRKSLEFGEARLLGAELGEAEPGPPGGWPEFQITLRFYVTSDNPEDVERERQRVFRQDWRVD